MASSSILLTLERVEESHATLLKKIEELQNKIVAFEVPDFESKNEVRTHTACLNAGLESFKLFRTQADYYSHDLEGRKNILKAPSIHNLCKSIILENTKCTKNDCSDPLNSRFYCVILQYTTKLMSHKVFKFVRGLTQGAVKGDYHFALAKPSDSFELTGSAYNGVCPVGNIVNVPIILSKRITELSDDFIWLGGGDPTLKLGFSASEFIEKFKPFVVDVTHEGFNTDFED